MKDNIIDARGLSCPQPVLLTKKAVDSGLSDIKILVDNTTAKENIKRFIENKGLSLQIEENNDGILLTVRR